jgi:N-methylhydantoinase A
MRLERSCDMRYQGQAYEVNVPAPGGTDLAGLVARFHAEHRRSYGQADEREPVELVNFRVTGIGVVARVRLAAGPGGSGSGAPVPKSERAAYFGREAGWRRCPVFARSGLGVGVELRGPALVEEPGATIVLYPGHVARVDGLGNLLVTTSLSPSWGRG